MSLVKTTPGAAEGGGKGRGGVKDGCDEGAHQSASTMAIINHQVCYFLSGDYLGENLEGGCCLRSAAVRILTVQPRE